MRYQPSYLDADLSERLTWDLSRVLANAHHTARPASFEREFVQLSYLYDVLRSMAEAGHLGFLLPSGLPVLEELMSLVQDHQVQLREGCVGESEPG